MDGIDGELVKMEKAGERTGHGVADRRVAFAVGSRPHAVAGEEAAQGADVGKRIVGKRGIAVIAEERGRAVLDPEESRIVLLAAGADAVAGRHRGAAACCRRRRQPSNPSTITISASATVRRIALAAW